MCSFFGGRGRVPEWNWCNLSLGPTVAHVERVPHLFILHSGSSSELGGLLLLCTDGKKILFQLQWSWFRSAAFFICKAGRKSVAERKIVTFLNLKGRQISVWPFVKCSRLQCNFGAIIRLSLRISITVTFVQVTLSCLGRWVGAWLF